MERYNNKYRIQSARLQNWNYESPGLYFITICTKNREHFFGEIVNDRMILNEIGLTANTEWEKTLQIRPDMNLELGEYIVMPNHLHGIIVIGENKFNAADVFYCRHAMHGVSTIKNKFGPQSKNLGSIMRGFKSAVTTFAGKNNLVFDWQAIFYDHIIRSQEEFIRISNYIINNPANWKEDKFFN